MGIDIQKAGIWQRLAAWILDMILVCIIGVGAAFLLSSALRIDENIDALQGAYDRYEAQYGVSFQMTEEEYNALTEEALQKHEQAYKALTADTEAMRVYQLVLNKILLTTTLSILIAILLLELLVPVLLKNGQTVGKKVFALGVVRTDGVKLNTLQLIVRSVLGKFTVETMIPVYVVIMTLFGSGNIISTLLLIALAVSQMLMISISKNNSAIHDMLAGTVVVDLSSQRVFASTEELVEYTKKVHAERAARQDY